MLVFASEFPMKTGCGRDSIIKVCKDWLIGSPHYPWSSEAELGWPDNEVVKYIKDGFNLQLGSFCDEKIKMLGLKLQWIEDQKREWTTEIVSIEKESFSWLSSKLFYESLIPSLPPPSPKKPYILKQLFSQIGGGLDGPFTVKDKPHFLKENETELAINLINGKLEFDLPVLYASTHFNGHPFIDVDKAAQWLSGIAHVIVEPSRAFSYRIAEASRGHNPYGGAVSIYWPNSGGKSYKLLPQDYNNSRDLLIEAQQILRDAWLYIKGENECSWGDLRERISSSKIESLKANKGTSLQEYIEAFDSENKALKDKVNTIESQRDAARKALQSIQNTKGVTSDGLLKFGEEKDLYPGEIQDCVLATLKEATDRSNILSRRYTIIDDLLRKNTITKTRSDLQETIKRILGKTTRVGASEIKQLGDIGFIIEDGGKHYKATYANDPRYSFTLFKTASDHRAGENLVSDISKILFKP